MTKIYDNEPPDEMDDWDASDWEKYFAGPEDLLQELIYEVEDEDQCDWEGDSSEVSEHLEWKSTPYKYREGRKVHSVGRGEVPEKQIKLSSYFYDDAGYYAYVLFNSSSEQFKGVLQYLRENGFDCPLAGKSYRLASNGVKYDWYVRIFDKEGSKPEHNIIHQHFKNIVKKPHVIDDGRIIFYEKIVKSAEEDKLRLREQLESLQQDIKLLQEEKAFLSRQSKEVSNNYKLLATKNENLEKKNEELQERLTRYSQHLEDTETTISSNQEMYLIEKNKELNEQIKWLERDVLGKEEILKTLQSEKLEMEALWEEYEARLDHQRQQVQNLVNARDIAETERDIALQRMKEMELNTSNITHNDNDNPWNSAIDAASLSELLSILLPKLQIDKGSICYLAKELPNPTHVFNKLRVINDNPAQLSSAKIVQSAKPWREDRYNTGQDDLGRLYFVEKSNGIRRVKISHKALQKRDIKYLKTLLHQG